MASASKREDGDYGNISSHITERFIKVLLTIIKASDDAKEMITAMPMVTENSVQAPCRFNVLTNLEWQKRVALEGIIPMLVHLLPYETPFTKQNATILIKQFSKVHMLERDNKEAKYFQMFTFFPYLLYPRSMHGHKMFKKFSGEDVSAQNQVKASVQRKIRQSIAEEYPGLEPVLDDILPKKSPLIVAKCQNHLNLVLVNNVPLFFSVRDGPYMPTLRLLHQYPNIMKKLQVDRGAIRFVLAGANIMCPGLTSPGGVLDEDVGAECPVAIMAEGKQHALAIGFTKMSAKDIKAINKGIGVDNLHYLNDGLWKMERLD
ncbi:hypothetical protein VNO78_01772 [Psophocarpus tetragonolobus]|uniref:PUA domain-containing protein n=1 Tax=Psophocarpus tetragonolobus TaxID=3891 RepID=A0AAN9T0Q5_PSOTE